MSLRTKVIGTMGLVIVVTGLGMALVFMRVRSTDAAYKVANNSVTAALGASQLRSAFQVEQQQAQNLLLQGADPNYFTSYQAQFATASKNVGDLRNSLAKSPGSGERQAGSRLTGSVHVGREELPGGIR